jgi:hypothetical protein
VRREGLLFLLLDSGLLGNHRVGLGLDVSDYAPCHTGSLLKLCSDPVDRHSFLSFPS